MLSFLKALRHDKRGNVLILMGAAMPLLVASAGLATDTIQWALWKRQLQRAADSAAIAGVYERTRAAGATTGVSAAVLKDASLNQHTGITLLNAVPATCPKTPATARLLCPDDETVGTVLRRNQVSVTFEVAKRLSFSSVFMASAPVIRVTSTAASVPGSEYCVIGLDPRATVSSIDIEGSTTLNMGTCSLMANSSNPTAAATNTGSGSTIVADSLDAVGGVSNSAKWTGVAYHPGSPAVQDPFAVGQPREATVPTCTSTASVGGNANIDRSATDAPVDGTRKVICLNGGIDVKANYILGAATYVLMDGDLKMTGNSLTCNGCTIVMSGSTADKIGNLKISGGELDITAPTTGPLAGIAIYQDRRAVEGSGAGSADNQVNGNTDSSINGVVYIPTRTLKINGGGTAAAPVCMQVIGKRVTFSGNSYIKVPSMCPSGFNNSIGGSQVVRLVA